MLTRIKYLNAKWQCYWSYCLGSFEDGNFMVNAKAENSKTMSHFPFYFVVWFPYVLSCFISCFLWHMFFSSLLTSFIFTPSVSPFFSVKSSVIYSCLYFCLCCCPTSRNSGEVVSAWLFIHTRFKIKQLIPHFLGNLFNLQRKLVRAGRVKTEACPEIVVRTEDSLSLGLFEVRLQQPVRFRTLIRAVISCSDTEGWPGLQ